MSTTHDTSEMVRAATEANASPEFVAVLATDAPNDGRHHPRNRMARELAEGGNVRRRMRHLSGHFVKALWDGDLDDAWARADSGNRRLLAKAGLAEGNR